MDSDDDFLPSRTSTTRNRLSVTRRPVGSTADRLSTVLGQAKQYIRHSNRGEASFADELGSRFSSFGRNRKKTKVKTWKVVPVCLQHPRDNTAPKRGVLGRLCTSGLGSKWFTTEDRLEIADYLSPQELHFLIVCLYPQLKGIPYEFCKAAGPGNSVIVTLNICDERRKPRRGKAFHPFFCAKQLKEQVGRKGKLYIRPLESITSVCPSLSEIEAYTPKFAIACPQCGDELSLSEIPSHVYMCAVDEVGVRSAASTSSHGTEGGETDASSLPQDPREPHSPVILAGQSGVSPTVSAGQPGLSSAMFADQFKPTAIDDYLPQGSVPHLNLSGSSDLSDSTWEKQQTLPEPIEVTRAIRHHQDEEYAESLRIDQESERIRVENDEQAVRNSRIEAWYERIRDDMKESMTPEPAEGLDGVVHVRVRLPNGRRVSRRFNSSNDVKELRCFVGSHECINPRHFRLLISEVPHYRILCNEGSLGAAGIQRFTLVTAENTVFERESSAPRESSVSLGSPAINSDMDSDVYSMLDEVASHPTDVVDLTETANVDKMPSVLLHTNLKELQQMRSSLRHNLTLNGVHLVEVGRLTVFDELLKVYRENSGIIKKELRVRFRGESGVDGGGLSRELFPAFWQSAEQRVFEGHVEKIPLVTPETADLFLLMGTILSHGYVLTGYFPLYFAKTLTSELMCENNDLVHDLLYQSFLGYIDATESEAVTKYLVNSQENLLQEVIIPMLSRFNCCTNPSPLNFKEVIIKTARCALICLPFFAIAEMKRGMLRSFPQLWGKCHASVVTNFLNDLLPTTQKVWAMVCEPEFATKSEARVFDFFRRFVLSLNPEYLAKLLRFITGNPQCSGQNIEVNFCFSESEFSRRPTASTCGMVIHIPINYNSFATFSQEFKNILDSCDSWFFDAM